MDNNNHTSCKYIVVPQEVKVRKYDINVKRLLECLRTHKNISNKQIAKELNIPVTKVEHWFRQDDCFAIPDAEIWYQLKSLLGIRTNEFDKAITEFEIRIGIYEKSERYYLDSYLAPTLTTSCEYEKIIIKCNNPKTRYEE